MAFIVTTGNVCKGFISTSTIWTLIRNFGMGFSSRKPGKHPICAIEVRDMLCNPYPERLREPLHDFIHPFPVDQREIVCVNNPPQMEKLLRNLFPPQVRYLSFGGAGNVLSTDGNYHALGREEILDKCLCCESCHQIGRSKFIGPDIYPLEQSKLISPEVLVQMTMNMNRGTPYSGLRYQLFKIPKHIQLSLFLK